MPSIAEFPMSGDVREVHEGVLSGIMLDARASRELSRNLTQLLRYSYSPGFHNMADILRRRRFHGISTTAAADAIRMETRGGEPRFHLQGEGGTIMLMLMHMEAHRNRHGEHRQRQNR